MKQRGYYDLNVTGFIICCLIVGAANMQLVRTGDDEFMLVTYKNAKAQCDGGKCGIGGYCDDCPTPQADSQPAPVEVVDAMAQQWVPCLLEIDAIRAGATERGE